MMLRTTAVASSLGRRRDCIAERVQERPREWLHVVRAMSGARRVGVRVHAAPPPAQYEERNASSGRAGYKRTRTHRTILINRPLQTASSASSLSQLEITMFAKLTSTVVAFAILAVATAAPNNTPSAPAAPAPSAPASGGDCSTGALQCCQSVESGSSAAVAPILAALGIVLQDVNIPVGLSCSGIAGVGVGGSDSW